MEPIVWPQPFRLATESIADDRTSQWKKSSKKGRKRLYRRFTAQVRTPDTFNNTVEGMKAKPFAVRLQFKEQITRLSGSASTENSLAWQRRLGRASVSTRSNAVSSRSGCVISLGLGYPKKNCFFCIFCLPRLACRHSLNEFARIPEVSDCLRFTSHRLLHQSQ